MGTIKYQLLEGEFLETLRSGYIDGHDLANSRFEPQLVTNDSQSATSLLSVLKRELSECDRFDFSVAFITDDGLATLVGVLNELERRNVPGRLLTTTYNNFNNPEVLRKLLEYSNIECRVFQGNLHTKGYLFDKGEIGTVIIGSSNLTQKALRVNKEWNFLFHSYADGRMLRRSQEEFDSLWNNPNTVEITKQWLDEYQAYLESAETSGQGAKKPLPTFSLHSVGEIQSSSSTAIVPNDMQVEALRELEVIHDQQLPRALLISATGTGKTYLAALDVQQEKPERVLFVAHRERILEASLESFKRVLGDTYSYELYKSGKAKPKASCVFAMVRTLNLHLSEFDPGEFDYIVIDEAHHVGASGYLALLDYFTPKFFLGMTATPNRMDGYDIFAQFNNCIAYRITLQDALQNDLLVPFHYFGIADLEIDDQVVDNQLFNQLTSQERVKHVIQKIEEYSVSKKNRRGLIFCSRIQEAEHLSSEFNKVGYRTAFISGADSDETVNDTIQRLESGDLEYIFTVDKFNEGIDIPSLNQIIMLRRTDSPIIFVQQLGRGLRKDETKEYTLVLDFIGNYQKNYLVPIALSGDRTYNKDNLRRIVKEPDVIIPGCSTISFDRVSEARVLKAIDGSNFNEVRLLRDEYEALKQELGHIPSILDFDKNQSIDPLRFITKVGSYYEFLLRYEDSYDIELSQNCRSILKYVSQKMASGKRISDLLLIKMLVENGHVRQTSFKQAAEHITDHTMTIHDIDSAFNLLSGIFFSAENLSLIRKDGDCYIASDLLIESIENEEFRKLLLETIEFGLGRHQKRYSQAYRDTDFVLYEKYTYEDVCKLLGWERTITPINIGGYKYDEKTNTFPIFINYEKDPDISDTIRYEDRFVSNRVLIAISKQPRDESSPEIMRLKAWPGNGMKSFLFIRKNKNDGDSSKEFYFLGEVFPTQQYEEFTMRGTDKSAVKITYELETPVRADLYDYLTTPLEVDSTND